MDFDALLKLLDLPILIAIIGITEVVKRVLPEDKWRYIPLAPLALGVLAGAIFTEVNLWKVYAKNMVYYAGGSSLFYELLRTTILKQGAKKE